MTAMTTLKAGYTTDLLSAVHTARAGDYRH